MQVTTTVRLCDPGSERPLRATREFSALPAGLSAMTDWVLSHGVTAAPMEGMGIFWKATYEALEEAGLVDELFHAQHVRQIRGRKTDRNDCIWLARVCQYGLATPSFVPPRPFRDLRQTSRYRRSLTADRSRLKNRLHKALNHCGLRLGGAPTDILGLNGRRILDGLVAGRTTAQILPTLSGHVRRKRVLLEQVLQARPDAYTLFRLRDLLLRIDEVDRSLSELDELLETTPGIDRGSACAILIELGLGIGGRGERVPSGRLGGRGAGQPQERRQAPQPRRAQAQPDAEDHPGRVRAGSGSDAGNAVSTPPQGAPGRGPLQAGHPGDGAQDAAHHLRDAARQQAVSRPGRGVRKAAGAAQRAALAAQAEPVRIPGGALARRGTLLLFHYRARNGFPANSASQALISTTGKLLLRRCCDQILRNVVLPVAQPPLTVRTHWPS